MVPNTQILPCIAGNSNVDVPFENGTKQEEECRFSVGIPEKKYSCETEVRRLFRQGALKTKSRGARFQGAAQELLDAIVEARSFLEDLSQQATLAVETINDYLKDLRVIREEYEDWQCNLPENLQSSVMGEKLQAICDIDLDVEVPELEVPDFYEVENAAEECLNADVPLGFGRD